MGVKCPKCGKPLDHLGDVEGFENIYQCQNEECLEPGMDYRSFYYDGKGPVKSIGFGVKCHAGGKN